MGADGPWISIHQHQPELWREHGLAPADVAAPGGTAAPPLDEPDPAEQSRLFDLLGKIDYQIVKGDTVYIQVRGIAYRVLYGAYWCSIYTGVKHFLLRCEEIGEGMWIEGNASPNEVDLPIRASTNGWVVENYSLKLLLNRELTRFDESPR